VESGHFQALIDKICFIDLETQNGLFTWSNRCMGSQQVACHLDRFLVSESLLMDGLSLNANILDTVGSNHWPIQLSLDISGSPRRNPFIFEHFWLTHPSSKPWPLTWWREAAIPHGSKMYHFQQRLKNFKQCLKIWNKQNFGNIFEAQRNLNDQMKLLQTQIRNHGLTEELREQENILKQQVEERRSQEEVLWRKKS
jgi:hypothetical protein